MQTFGALLHKVHGVQEVVNQLSTSAMSLLQVVVSTVDADDDMDEDVAAEGDGMESRDGEDNEDGKRVNVALMGTGTDSGDYTYT